MRCAIYTRKSSEEGLEQSFNSLDAQREACEAFILSQRHEGWRTLPARYDDGGYSGGTMERPGTEASAGGCRGQKINVIVVYKVDRLTRSLADFAKIVEALDARGVSFVSVTQQFNTTTSMGRLTLNILLSFAQFEREVTGERIRDKIAASKKKGMWMGDWCRSATTSKDASWFRIRKRRNWSPRFFPLPRTGLRLEIGGATRARKDQKQGLDHKTGARLGGVAFARGAPLLPAAESSLYR